MTLTLSHLSWRSKALPALLLGALLVAALWLALPGSSPASGASAAVSGPAAGAAPADGLASVAGQDPARRVEVIAQFRSAAAFSNGRHLVAVYGGVVTRNLHLIDAYGVRMSAGAALRLSRDPALRAVTLNSVVRTSSASDDGADDCGGPSVSWLGSPPCAVRTSFLQSTRTDKLWRRGDTGGSGLGVGVAVVDTGIDGGLADFRVSPADSSSRVIASAVTNPDATVEDDLYGHGTHVAGLIAGNGSLRDAEDPLRGQYIGAAPRANLISVKVSDDAGVTSLIDVIYGVQFAVDHEADYGIRVINLSLTSATPSSYLTDPLDAAVESAWRHGIVVVAAAGNRGADTGSVDYAPGNDPYVITVGAVDDQATKRTSDDVPADWSSRGVSEDGVAKPDLVAPGAHIVAPYAPGSAFGSLCPDCIVDGQYFRIGGTSMSAAVVSGIVADLLELHPEWTPDQVKGALTSHVRKVSGSVGEVDAQAADKAGGADLTANTGLVPNALVDPATGDVDYTRASWTRASWTQVEADRASWTRASWTCDCALAVAGQADPTRASWTRASWTRASWTASFTK